MEHAEMINRHLTDGTLPSPDPQQAARPTKNRTKPRFLPVTREEAIQFSLKRYFTGEECKYGHVSERYVKGSRCVECSRVQSYARYLTDKAKDPEAVKQRINESVRRHYENNRESLLAKKKAYYENNRDLLKERTRNFRAKKKLNQANEQKGASQ